jgi:hypothetical protein
VDFTALAQNFGQTYNPNAGSPLGALLPEPTMFGAIAAMGMIRRRRQQN